MEIEVIPKEEIEKLKNETEQQLDYAKKQAAFWDTKVKELVGSLAVCNVILQKKKRQIPKKKNG